MKIEIKFNNFNYEEIYSPEVWYKPCIYYSIMINNIKQEIFFMFFYFNIGIEYKSIIYTDFLEIKNIKYYYYF